MGGMVWVACKIPQGLKIDIADLAWTEVGGIKIAVRENVREVFLNGTAAQRRLESAGVAAGEVGNVAHGFGLTPIDADLWDRWIEENKNYAPVMAGMVFAASREADVRAKAKDFAKKRSGLEPMMPPEVDRQGNIVGEFDPRLPKGIQPADVPAAG